MWKYKTGGRVWSSPVVYDGIVFFGSNDGYLYALASNTRELLWKYKTGGSVSSSPVVYDGKKSYSWVTVRQEKIKLEETKGALTYVSITPAQKTLILCNDVPKNVNIIPTETMETIPVPEELQNKSVQVQPLVCDNIAVLCIENKVYFLNIEENKIVKQIELQNEIFTTPSLFGKSLIVCDYTGKVYCINIEAQKVIWQKEVGNAISTSPVIPFLLNNVPLQKVLYLLIKYAGMEVPAYAEIPTYFSKRTSYSRNGIIYNGRIFLLTRSGKLCELYVDGNTQIKEVGDYNNGGYLALYGKNLIMAVDNKIIIKKLETNEEYIIDEIEGTISFYPVIGKEKIFVGTDKGYLYAIDVKNKTILWKKELNKIVSGQALAEDRIVVSTPDTLYTIDINSGEIIWEARNKTVLSTPVIYDNHIFFAAKNTLTGANLYLEKSINDYARLKEYYDVYVNYENILEHKKTKEEETQNDDEITSYLSEEKQKELLDNYEYVSDDSAFYLINDSTKIYKIEKGEIDSIDSFDLSQADDECLQKFGIPHYIYLNNENILLINEDKNSIALINTNLFPQLCINTELGDDYKIESIENNVIVIDKEKAILIDPNTTTFKEIPLDKNYENHAKNKYEGKTYFVLYNEGIGKEIKIILSDDTSPKIEQKNIDILKELQGDILLVRMYGKFLYIVTNSRDIIIYDITTDEYEIIEYEGAFVFIHGYRDLVIIVTTQELIVINKNEADKDVFNFSYTPENLRIKNVQKVFANVPYVNNYLLMVESYGSFTYLVTNAGKIFVVKDTELYKEISYEGAFELMTDFENLVIIVASKQLIVLNKDTLEPVINFSYTPQDLRIKNVQEVFANVPYVNNYLLMVESYGSFTYLVTNAGKIFVVKDTELYKEISYEGAFELMTDYGNKLIITTTEELFILDKDSVEVEINFTFKNGSLKALMHKSESDTGILYFYNTGFLLKADMKAGKELHRVVGELNLQENTFCVRDNDKYSDFYVYWNKIK